MQLLPTFDALAMVNRISIIFRCQKAGVAADLPFVNTDAVVRKQVSLPLKWQGGFSSAWLVPHHLLGAKHPTRRAGMMVQTRSVDPATQR